MATRVRTGSGSSCWDTDTRAHSQQSGIPENLRHTLYGLIRLGVTPVKVREHLGCAESIHLAPQALDAVETNSYTGYAAPLYCLPFFAMYVGCPSVFGNGTVHCLGRDGIGRVGRFAAAVITGGISQVGAIAAAMILNSQLGRLHGARFVVSGVGLMTYGIVVLHALIENDLVDELHLMIFPVVLGTGKRVFGGRRSAHDPRTGWRDDRRWDASRTYIALRVQ
jgi:RibD C-terminal domain